MGLNSQSVFVRITNSANPAQNENLVFEGVIGVGAGVEIGQSGVTLDISDLTARVTFNGGVSGGGEIRVEVFIPDGLGAFDNEMVQSQGSNFGSGVVGFSIPSVSDTTKTIDGDTFDGSLLTFGIRPLGFQSGIAANQTVSFTVEDVPGGTGTLNIAPTITSNGGGSSALIITAENTTSVTDVQTTDADTEGSGLAYDISGGADASAFDIDASTGVLTFKSAPDFENPTDAGGNNVFNVQVRVTDSGGLTDTQDLTVTVTDVAAPQLQSITLRGETAAPLGVITEADAGDRVILVASFDQDVVIQGGFGFADGGSSVFTAPIIVTDPGVLASNEVGVSLLIAADTEVDLDSFLSTFSVFGATGPGLGIVGVNGEPFGGGTQSVLSDANDPTSFVEIDTVNPTITSIARLSPAGEFTNADAVQFLVTFSEGIDFVTNFASGFEVSGTTATVTDSVLVGPNLVVLTLEGGDLADLNGEVSIGLSSGQNITDRNGNPIINTTPTGVVESYTIDNTAPMLAAPADISLNTDPGLPSAVVTFPAPTVSDNQPGVSFAQTGGLPSGSAFPIGTTTNTFSATDAAGNTATASFTITVGDDEAPVLTVPGRVKLVVPFGDTGGVVNYPAPTATDNAPGVTIAQIAGLASGAVFGLGVTTNTFVATDASGNTDTESFDVFVVEESVTLTGTNGRDTLNGGTGDDTINGLRGNDLLNGNDGKDLLNGGGGRDTLNGGDGNDEINGDGGADIIDGGAGKDTIDGGSGSDNIDGGIGNDDIMGGSGSDTINGGDGNDDIDGGSGSDRITAGKGRDTVDGGSGNDNIDGGDGRDSLDGGTGNDTLIGGAGRDTLTGGTGNDLLEGGSGPDTFIFDGVFGNDRITDFNINQDTLDFGGTDPADLTFLQQGANTLIRVSGQGSVRVNNTDADDLAAIFAPPPAPLPPVMMASAPSVQTVTSFNNDEADLEPPWLDDGLHLV
ncbi:MAG: HYR domain-containing protein [Pseudomonadota bacterium]